MVNSKNELNIIVDDIDTHIIHLTESWAKKIISDSKLGLTLYTKIFRKDRL